MTEHSPLPPGSAVITPNQMYAEMQDIGRKVDHLASILDPALADLRADITEAEKQIVVIKTEREAAVAALDRRLRSLENWRWFMAGTTAAIGTIGGYGLSALLGA